jgi:lipopolysaccharide export system protein LptA
MLRVLIFVLAMSLPSLAVPQEASVGFGTVRADPDAPVEVTADQLNVSQSDGTATFTGNVVVGQGEMRLTAPTVRVIYAEETGDVSRMEATGGVTLVSGAEAAESQRADYDVGSGVIVMTGDVLLTQGRNALTSERMEVDLTSNTARMTGRVQTVLFPGEETAAEGE